MKTNGCTMAYYVNRQVHVCASHARMTRDETTSYQKPGAIARRTAYAEGATDRGVWMARGTERRMILDRELRPLDALAHRKVAPMGQHGLVIRKAVR